LIDTLRESLKTVGFHLTTWPSQNISSLFGSGSARLGLRMGEDEKQEKNGPEIAEGEQTRKAG